MIITGAMHRDVQKNWSDLPVRKWLGAEKVKSSIPAKSRLKLIIADAVIRLQNGCLQVVQKIIYRKPVKNISRLLVFRTGSLGDSLCAIPAIRAIRQQYPHTEIDILTNAGSKNLVGLHFLLEKELYNEIIDYQGLSRKALFSFLKKRKYDLVVQLPQVDSPFLSLLRDMMVFRGIARRGWGWRKSQVALFQKTQARYLQFYNETNRLLAILDKNGIKAQAPATFLHPQPADLAKAKELFIELGIDPHEKPVAIVVGAKRPQNRWPIQYFKELVTWLSARYTVVLVGSEEDAALSAPLHAMPRVVNACGQLSPMQSAAALSLCRLTISNDTGPMHLSYAVGTPTIGLFSSRDLPGKWFPPANHVSLRAEGIFCEACFSEICDNNVCMKSILPKDVIGRVEEMLSRDNLWYNFGVIQ